MSFKRLDPEDITISAESIIAPAWTGQVSTLQTFFTNSTQTLGQSGRFYHEVYQSDPTLSGSEVQFAVAYGHKFGSGSSGTNNQPGKTPSAIIYGQYRTLVNGDENTDFIFDTKPSDSIYVLSVNRARYKEKLQPGTFNLRLQSGSTILQLTDDSNTSNTVSYVDAGRVYNIVSGSNGVPITANNGMTPASGSYGKFLPDVGVVILNGNALKGTPAAGGIGLTINETSNALDGVNITEGFNAIKTGGSFTLHSEETITSNYVFIRVRNGENNYTTNPSNLTGTGELRYDVMVNSPQAYMTTVGLYNDNNDLLGVAKLSKPLLKDFTKEALIRIKLDY